MRIIELVDAAVSLTPGFLCSEVMLDNFGVTEANWARRYKEGSILCRFGDAVLQNATGPLVIGAARATCRHAG